MGRVDVTGPSDPATASAGVVPSTRAVDLEGVRPGNVYRLCAVEVVVVGDTCRTLSGLLKRFIVSGRYVKTPGCAKTAPEAGQ
jgi:hypothetical protein